MSATKARLETLKDIGSPSIPYKKSKKPSLTIQIEEKNMNEERVPTDQRQRTSETPNNRLV